MNSRKDNRNASAPGYQRELTLSTSFFLTDASLAPAQELSASPLHGTGWNALSQDEETCQLWGIVTFPCPEADTSSETTGNQAILLQIRDQSGLTWAQIARLFNVSRRSVHMWLDGGRMSAANEEHLHRLAAMVRALGADDPDGRRTLLLTPDPATGRSPFNQIRYDLASNDRDINRPYEPPIQTA